MKSFIKYVIVVAISGIIGYLVGKSSVDEKVRAEVYREKRTDGLLDSIKYEKDLVEMYRDMSENSIKKSIKKDQDILNVVMRMDKISKETIRKELVDISVDTEK